MSFRPRDRTDEAHEDPDEAHSAGGAVAWGEFDREHAVVRDAGNTEQSAWGQQVDHTSQ